MKWLRYQRVISLETQMQVGVTSQSPAGGGIRCLGGVSIPVNLFNLLAFFDIHGTSTL
jgi:hypothetical protein